MVQLNKSDIARAVKVLTGDAYTLVQIEDIIDAYGKVVRKSLMKGVAVNLAHVGKFKVGTVYGKPPRNGIINVQTSEIGMRPATKSYNKPVFTYSKLLREEMKDKTEDNIFNG